MAATPLTVTNAVLADGTLTSLRIVDGLVAAHGVEAQPGDVVLDADGGLVLPAMAEAHAHLDKAFLSETVPNPTGDLIGAIVAMEDHRHLITAADTEVRAERAARLLAAHGATAIRTHADVTTGNGMMSVAALLAVRERLGDLVHIEVMALGGWPVCGAAGAEQRALLREAVAMGVDGIGGCPHLEDDETGAVDALLDMAADAGLPLDLHTDEHLDTGRSTLAHLAHRVAGGFPHRVAASHAVSLVMRPEAEQRETAAALAAAGVSVIALPASNLFLQGRDHPIGTPRALAPARLLLDAGVNLAAGWDNLQDPFNPVGRGDCLETAALMVMAGHLLPHDAYHCVSNATRHVIGLPTAGTSIGDAADLVVLPSAGVRAAIAEAPATRTVVRGGRVVGR